MLCYVFRGFDSFISGTIVILLYHIVDIVTFANVPDSFIIDIFAITENITVLKF